MLQPSEDIKREVQAEQKQTLQIPKTNWPEMTVFEKHISREARKHQFNYFDLFYAAKTIEHKYKGNWDLEEIYASLVEDDSEQLCHEAYHCALFGKSDRAEIWPHHNPNWKDYPKNLDR